MLKKKNTKKQNSIEMAGHEFEYEDEFDEGYNEEFGYDNCPKCGRDYDEIDKEYQSCSKCGWDEAKKKWGEKRQPTDEDFMNGDADILTGRWY